MIFELECALITSDIAPREEWERLKKLIEPLLKKGAPEGEGCSLELFKFDGNRIEIELSSGRYVRPHSAILRIKNLLSRELGKRKIGIRSLSVSSYRAEIELEEEPIQPFEVPFSELEFKGKVCHVLFRDLDERAFREGYPDRIVDLIKEKVKSQHYGGKGEYWKLLWKSQKKGAVWDKDPSEEMVRLKWIKQGPSKGRWFFYPPMAEIMKKMEDLAIKEILAPLGFREVMSPHVVPFDIWIKTGHLEGVPGEIYYVSEPSTRDPDEWSTFSDLVRVTKSVPEFGGLLTDPVGGITYAQCPVIYWAFEGSTIEPEELPIKVFDRTAISCRYESGGRHGIERVDEFHRIEPVFIGTPDQMLSLRMELIERFYHLFEEVLHLDWRMAWVTPFYMQQAGEIIEKEEREERVPKSISNIDLEGREKGTIDFESYMPYRKGWLEFQNLTIVGEKYTKAFRIKAPKRELWSGCAGIGLERWCASYLAQKGLDPKNWDIKVKDLGEPIRFL
jgi:seryl-tRNA synthetase